MFALNPIVALLFNQKLGRWHPIYYTEAPLPGPPSPDKPVRHRSRGHHTDGYATRPEALEGAKAIGEALDKDCTGKCKYALAEDLAWDGEDIPADTAFFIDLPDGSVKCVL